MQGLDQPDMTCARTGAQGTTACFSTPHPLDLVDSHSNMRVRGRESPNTQAAPREGGVGPAGGAVPFVLAPNEKVNGEKGGWKPSIVCASQAA